MVRGMLILQALLQIMSAERVFAFTDPDAEVGPRVRVRSGESVTLACTGLGRSPFVVALTWRCRACGDTERHSRLLLDYRNGRTVALADQRMRLDTPAYSLVIRQVKPDDSGTYVCHANSRQQPKAVVALEVIGAAGESGRPMVLGFSSREANISWMHPKRTNFSPVQHYVVHIRETEIGVWYRSERTRGNETRYTVTDLLPYTVYSFRVIALNSVGPGRPSKPSFPIQTLREVPSGRVLEFRAVSAGSQQIVLSWKRAAAGTLHGEFVGYHMTYGSPSSGMERHLVITDESVTSLKVTGLDPFTQYIFTLKIRNPEGFGPYSTTNGTTQGAVPDRPALLESREVGSSWVEVRWTRPLKNNGILQRYVIDVASHQSTNQIIVPSTNQFSYQLKIDKLAPFTNYNISIYAESAFGSGSSRILRFRTDTDPPMAPRILAIECTEEGSTRIRWQAAESSSKPPIGFFNIGFRNSRERKYQLSKVAAGGGEYAVVLRQLDAGITYFKVQSVRRSIYKNIFYKSDFTQIWSVLLPKPNSDCAEFRVVAPSPATFTVSATAGVVSFLLVLVSALVIAALLIRRKRRLQNKSSCGNEPHASQESTEHSAGASNGAAPTANKCKATSWTDIQSTAGCR